MGVSGGLVLHSRAHHGLVAEAGGMGQMCRCGQESPAGSLVPQNRYTCPVPLAPPTDPSCSVRLAWHPSE